MTWRPDRPAAAALIGAAAVGLLAWPYAVITPSSGLDASFIAGLHLAGGRGLDVGTEIVSTYGPLGFLAFPQPVYGLTSVLALLHTAAIYFALVWILVHRSATVVPLWAALPLSFIGAQAIRWLGVPEAALALAVIVALLLLERRAAGIPLPGRALGAVAAGVAVLGLGKLNTGAVIVAISVIAVGFIGPRRQLLIYLGLLAAFGSAAWLGAGQGLANVAPFIATSASTILGFNAAMGVDADPAAYWQVAAAGVAIAALAYARVDAVSAWPVRLRVALVAVVVLALFVTFKASFVRWHSGFIFATLVILSIATLSPRVTRRAGLLGVACVLIAFLAATRQTAWAFLDPTPRYALAQLATLFANAETAAGNRQALAADYAVDESILHRIGRASVHIGPLESGVALAHDGLAWRPLPVYQDYIVYSPTLDDVNRATLADEGAAPQFILRGPPAAIDSRYPWFEGPATMRAMLCRYREVELAGEWQLLERGADRCEEPRLLSRVAAEVGVAVPVPELEDGDAMLFVRINGLEPTVLDAASSFLFKAHEWYITRNESDRFRLAAPTAGQGLVMAVGPSLAYTDRFGLGAAWDSVSLAPGPYSSGAGGPLEFEFWTVNAAAVATLPPPGRVRPPT